MGQQHEVVPVRPECPPKVVGPVRQPKRCGRRGFGADDRRLQPCNEPDLHDDLLEGHALRSGAVLLGRMTSARCWSTANQTAASFPPRQWHHWRGSRAPCSRRTSAGGHATRRGGEGSAPSIHREYLSCRPQRCRDANLLGAHGIRAIRWPGRPQRAATRRRVQPMPCAPIRPCTGADRS